MGRGKNHAPSAGPINRRDRWDTATPYPSRWEEPRDQLSQDLGQPHAVPRSRAILVSLEDPTRLGCIPPVVLGPSSRLSSRYTDIKLIIILLNPEQLMTLVHLVKVCGHPRQGKTWGEGLSTNSLGVGLQPGQSGQIASGSCCFWK